MSRRESRDSDSRRHRSRFDREPSPKRSRRDGKPVAERVPSSNNLDNDHTHRRRLQAAVPLEAPSVPYSKGESGSLAKDSDKKPNGFHEQAKGSSDPTEAPRSQSFFQHDERSNAGQVGRSFSRRAAGERDWRRDSRNQKYEGASDKKESYDTRQRDEKAQAKGDDKSVWSHDGFHKLEADLQAPARKRRAFREEKIPLDSENADKTALEQVNASAAERPPLGSERREDRSRNSHHSEIYDRPPTRERLANREESQRVGYPSRQRYGSGGGGGFGDYRGRDRYDRRQEFHLGGTQGDKWKHDLFQEANRSPTPKDEEDRIAKLEALLSS